MDVQNSPTSVCLSGVFAAGATATEDSFPPSQQTQAPGHANGSVLQRNRVNNRTVERGLEI